MAAVFPLNMSLFPMALPSVFVFAFQQSQIQLPSTLFKYSCPFDYCQHFSSRYPNVRQVELGVASEKSDDRRDVNDAGYTQISDASPRRIKGKRKKNWKQKVGDSKSSSQDDLLRTLESTFDYEGRISSKFHLIEDEFPKTPIIDYANGAADDDSFDRHMTHQVTDRPHRTGLITILGKPNMGKSTLLNALLEEELAIATSRPQTTRHAILGVLTTPNTQLCLTDTPGLISNPAYRLQENMMDAVKGSVRDCDLYLVVSDVFEENGRDVGSSDNGNDDYDGDGDVIGLKDDNFMGIGPEMMHLLQTTGKPAIVCVNKIDLVRDKRSTYNGSDESRNGTPEKAIQIIQKWRSLLPNAFAIIPTAAACGPMDPGVLCLRSILLANEQTNNIDNDNDSDAISQITDDTESNVDSKDNHDVGDAVVAPEYMRAKRVDVGAAIRMLGRPVPGMFPSHNAPKMLDSSEAKKLCQSLLPPGPPLYHPDFFTDRTDRFCASELIRETLFTKLGKELPYCCEVRVGMFDESQRYAKKPEDLDGEDKNFEVKSDNWKNKKKREGLIRIAATILVERDSQKGIVVGKGGRKIKEVGIDARKKLQEVFDARIFLDLSVKVDKDWRNNLEKLKKYGYT